MKVTVLLIVVGALGTVVKGLGKRLEESEIRTGNTTPVWSEPGGNVNEKMIPLSLEPHNYLESYVRYPLLCVRLLNPSVWSRCGTRSILMGSLIGLNLETDCHTEAKKLSLPYYTSITGGRIVGFIPFQRVLALCKIHTC